MVTYWNCDPNWAAQIIVTCFQVTVAAAKNTGFPVTGGPGKGNMQPPHPAGAMAPQPGGPGMGIPHGTMGAGSIGGRMPMGAGSTIPGAGLATPRAAI